MGKYYSLAEARTDGITDPPYSDDQVNRAIAESEELFERLTSRQFDKRTLTLFFDGDGTEFLYIKEYPIVSIEYIKIDGETIASDFYRVYEDHISMVKNTKNDIYASSSSYVFSEGTQNIEVKGDFGYESTSGTFAVVKRAIRLMVKDNLEGNLAKKEYLSEKIGDYSYRVKDSAPTGTLLGEEIDLIIKQLKRNISVGII